MTQTPKPKMLVKDHRWGNQEVAHNTGIWPFTFGAWKMTIYPYVHEKDGYVLWLDPDIEHTHAFTEQNVTWHYLLPEWNEEKQLYDETEKMPFCLYCGVFMSKYDWDCFERSREMVELSVKEGKNV